MEQKQQYTRDEYNHTTDCIVQLMMICANQQREIDALMVVERNRLGKLSKQPVEKEEIALWEQRLQDEEEYWNTVYQTGEWDIK